MVKLDKIFLDESKLKLTGKSISLADKTKEFFKYQLETWPFAANGFKSLESVQAKTFEFDNTVIKVQFNPGRIISSSAKVDKKSVESRNCFLCYKALPEEQKGIPYFRDYLILVNPFPIFPEHFTIPKIDHVPQQISGNMKGLLNISMDLGQHYCVFYNGPRCGASAPDHMHFQAGTKDFMPLKSETESLPKTIKKSLYADLDSEIWAIDDKLRKYFLIQSSDSKDIRRIFKKVYAVLQSLDPFSQQEPMMNLISYYENKKWKVAIFPRMRHRPDHYFKEGDSNLLLSPAAVDLGGVFITPMEKDFNKINKDLIKDIMRQVSVSSEMFDYFQSKIRATLQSEE